MHMHATRGDTTLQNTLIRQSFFVAQLSRGAGLDEDWPWPGG